MQLSNIDSSLRKISILNLRLSNLKNLLFEYLPLVQQNFQLRLA